MAAKSKFKCRCGFVTTLVYDEDAEKWICDTETHGNHSPGKRCFNCQSETIWPADKEAPEPGGQNGAAPVSAGNEALLAENAKLKDELETLKKKRMTNAQKKAAKERAEAEKAEAEAKKLAVDDPANVNTGPK
jgi:hypothetical protein